MKTIIMNIRFTIVLLLLFTTLSASSQTIFARSNGDWDQTSVWSLVGTGGASCGCTPAIGDDVLIDGYDVDIDAGTGDVTVNSVKITNTRGTDVRLRVQAGRTLTITTDFEIENNSGGRDAELTVVGTGSGLDITGDFLADQDDGDDLLIDIDTDAQVNILGDADFLQDGGDDMELNLNQNSGTAAQWNVGGNITFDHDGGDDMRVLVDDGFSLLHVDGNLIVNMNAGLDDDIRFNLDNGTFSVDGDAVLTRSGNTSHIDFDMDGGDFSCDDITINSSGPLFSLGAVRFFLDQASQLDCNSLAVTFTGADDFYIHLNQNGGTTAQFNVANDFILTRTAGDDIEIMLDGDSQLTIGGDFLINSSGPDSERFEIRLTDNSVLDITGDYSFTITDGEDVAGNAHIIQLTGTAPLFHVGGDFSWTSSINLVDMDIDINNGLMDVDGNFTIAQNAGADDFDIAIDNVGQLTIGGNMAISLNGGDDLTFNLGSNVGGSTASCTVAGNCTLIHNNNSSSSTFEHQIFEDTRFNVGGELTIQANFTASPRLRQDVTNTAEVSVTGNVNFTAISVNEVEVRLRDDAFFRIGGNFVRAAAPNNFGELNTADNSTVEYNGTIAQIIAEDAGSGSDAFIYTNLEIDNSFGTIPQLTLEGDVTVNGDLTMNDGIVASDVTNILIVANNATTSNASDDSYVDGYMRKVGNDAFTFPSGNGGRYGAIGISAPSVTSEQFEAQYFLTMPHAAGFDSTMHDPSIHHISKVEYWKLNRTSGASNPAVTLSWDTPRSGGVVNSADLRFMRWDGAIWRDFGAASLTGSPAAGTLDNNTGITTYLDGNPYTIGTIDPINPLPIELISFTAILQEDIVRLNWITKSEINSDYFDLEKSTNGIDWDRFAAINAAGNSSAEIQYAEQDKNPTIGLSYYRLKQVDFDGKYEYFGPITVEKASKILVYPNPTNGNVYVVGDIEKTNVKLYSIAGQELAIQIISQGDKLTFNTEHLANGTYYLSLNGSIQRIVVSH